MIFYDEKLVSFDAGFFCCSDLKNPHFAIHFYFFARHNNIRDAK